MSYTYNPIATVEQNAYERQALAIHQHPKVVAAREDIRRYWLEQAQPGEDMLSCFDSAFEEVMFGAVIWSLNQDPLRPAVVTISRLPHTLGELQIPGSRWGIDNPDSVYRVIPISGDERYRIHGKVAGHRLTENYFTLWDRDMNTVDVLSGKDLVLDSEGRFTISVDNQPAGERVNHIQSNSSAHQFYIRDVLQDWHGEMINSLAIERLGATGEEPVSSEDEQVESAIQFMRDYVDNTMRWNQQALSKPVNAFDFTIDRDTDGALRNQIYILGQFKLDEGQALLLNITMGGADYFIAPITNLWGTTNDIYHRNGSLNKAQARANADGSYTFVVSVEDPGIHNWIDPGDMHEGILTLRWAEFENDIAGDDLAVDSQVVSVAGLESLLPEGCEKTNSDERKMQLERRAQSYQWRLLENFGE